MKSSIELGTKLALAHLASDSDPSSVRCEDWYCLPPEVWRPQSKERPGKGQSSLGRCRTKASKDSHCFNGSFSLPFSPHIRCRPGASTPCGIECQVTFWPLISKSLSGPFASACLKTPQLGPQWPTSGAWETMPPQSARSRVCTMSQCPVTCHLGPSQPSRGAVGHHGWSSFERDPGKTVPPTL